jgi:hypothetical protein
MTRRIKVYVHRDKESNYDLARKLDCDGPDIKYLCSEVELIVDLDTETGHGKVVGAEGFYLGDERVSDTDIEGGD